MTIKTLKVQKLKEKKLIKKEKFFKWGGGWKCGENKILYVLI